jgi:hypothetical protein
MPPFGRTIHMCVESNDHLKIVRKLFIRWWNQLTGVVLQGTSSKHHKVLWWQRQGIERYGKGQVKSVVR